MLVKDVLSFSKLAVPIIVAELAYGGSSFVAVMMTARLGQAELAASALVLSIFVTIMSLCWGIISVVSVFIAHDYGAGNFKRVGLLVRHGFLVTIFLSLGAMLIFSLAPLMMRYLGQNPVVIILATPYLHALMWSVLPDLGTSLLEQFLFGVFCPIFATISAVSLLVLTSLLSYVFVFGKLGIHPMGLAGLGWARTISAVIIFVLMVVYMARQEYFHRFALFTSLMKGSKKVFYELLKIGVPIGLNCIIEVSCFMVVAIFMGWFDYGVIAQAWYQVFLQFVEIGLIMALGLAQASAISVGSVMGAGEEGLLKRATFISLIVPVLFVFSMVFFYWLFPTSLISLDLAVHHINNTELVNLAIPFIVLAGFFQLFDAIRLVAAGILRAFRDTHYLMWQSVVCFWLIGLPLGYCLAFVADFGALGLVLGLVAGAAFGAMMALDRLYKVFQQYELLPKSQLDSAPDLL